MELLNLVRLPICVWTLMVLKFSARLTENLGEIKSYLRNNNKVLFLYHLQVYPMADLIPDMMASVGTEPLCFAFVPPCLPSGN